MEIFIFYLFCWQGNTIRIYSGEAHEPDDLEFDAYQSDDDDEDLRADIDLDVDIRAADDI